MTEGRRKLKTKILRFYSRSKNWYRTWPATAKILFAVSAPVAATAMVAHAVSDLGFGWSIIGSDLRAGAIAAAFLNSIVLLGKFVSAVSLTLVAAACGVEVTRIGERKPSAVRYLRYLSRALRTANAFGLAIIGANILTRAVLANVLR
jgi:hypothetical protein